MVVCLWQLLDQKLSQAFRTHRALTDPRELKAKSYAWVGGSLCLLVYEDSCTSYKGLSKWREAGTSPGAGQTSSTLNALPCEIGED